VRFIVYDGRGWQLDAYLDYLHKNAERFPRNARDFALAEWHYDMKHHQCPHDSWLESFAIKERVTGERDQKSTADIESLFLGSFHDGLFSLTYRDVRTYSLQLEPHAPAGRAHGDWLVDEVTLTDEGLVRHEIEFERASLTVICADLEYRGLPHASRARH
jgi:hypothetical protein